MLKLRLMKANIVTRVPYSLGGTRDAESFFDW